MKTIYSPDHKAHPTIDDKNRVPCSVRDIHATTYHHSHSKCRCNRINCNFMLEEELF